MITTTQKLIIAAFGIALIYIIGRFFSKQSNNDYEKAYTEILTSEKYKVKGRFEE